MHAAPATTALLFHAKTPRREEKRNRTTKSTKPLCIANDAPARAARNKGASRRTKIRTFLAEHLGVLGGLGGSNLLSFFFAPWRLGVKHSALPTNDPQRATP
jgi:hypothetical protein